MDVFGAALLDHHRRGRSRSFLVQRDDGFEFRDQPGRYFETEPWPYEVPALAWISGPVLDVGCGAGRHLLWLEGRGIAAMGVDASAAAVRICRERGCGHVLHRDVMTAPLAPIARRPETITLFGNNVGIGGSYSGACDLFRRLSGVVAPGGRMIVTGFDVSVTDKPVHQAYQERNLAAGRRRGEIRMRFQYRRQTGPWMAWYHPEPDEVESIAGASGWDVQRMEIQNTGLFWAVLRHQG